MRFSQSKTFKVVVFVFVVLENHQRNLEQVFIFLTDVVFFKYLQPVTI